MPAKEAKARIKINNLLTESGWRLLDDQSGKANVVLENHVKITNNVADDLGEDFEKTSNGYADYLLLDEKGFPLLVLEAKSEDKNPLVGKEQARKYARSQNCGYIILSNGNIHYFWDIEKANPTIISKFPTQQSIKYFSAYKPQPDRLINEKIFEDYIANTQRPNYCHVPEYQDKSTREQFVQTNKLRFLRKYQVDAVKAIQNSVSQGNERFLFEMATGTGKTLVSAAVIKLFLRTGNAKRVLFLVDRLELETQVWKAFTDYLKNDYKTIIYKERKDDWRHAEIVVTTVQSLLFNNKFTRLFSPTDFDLVISDEAHRSIGGNARALFEYFIGYKLGLTATPRDYLKRFDSKNPPRNDPREYERRLLLDTYRTFGCDSGTPTFRYSLIDGVNEGFLINPVVIDARTDVTTQLLSDQGYSVVVPPEGEADNEDEQSFFQRDFEKKFFSDDTNRVFCKAFLENAFRDPITNEVGKSIIFAVSQNHAAKLTQILNELAHLKFPGKYNSDFALQVTSLVSGAQQFTINFTDKSNNLSGTANFEPWYRTSKTRVCVTVGMMTTGYDCTDLLNICLMRPIFSPTDFIQIKGRGTRTHNFTTHVADPPRAKEVGKIDKNKFKLFDFFGNYEYFEEKFQYDQLLKLPLRRKNPSGPIDNPPQVPPEYENFDPDILHPVNEINVGLKGMKIDRMFFDGFSETVKKDEVIVQSLEEGNWDKLLDYINREIMNKPEEFYTIEKLRRSIKTDRRVTMREIVEYIFGLIPFIKSREELLDEEFNKFITDCKPGEKDDIIALKYFFKSYITDGKLRDIIESRKFAELNVNPSFSTKDFKAVPEHWRFAIPEYIKDYVPLNKFTN